MKLRKQSKCKAVSTTSGNDNRNANRIIENTEVVTEIVIMMKDLNSKHIYEISNFQQNHSSHLTFIFFLFLRTSLLLSSPHFSSFSTQHLIGYCFFASFLFFAIVSVSAPAPSIFNLFGFSIPNLCVRAREVIAFYSPCGAPSLLKYPRFPRLGSLH